MISQSYYQQLTADVLIAAAYATDLLNGNLTHSDWYERGDYLRKSYSYNAFDFKHQNISNTTKHSLYFGTV